MYIQLMSRHFGVHTPIKHIEIPCNFSEVYKGDDNIDEEILIKSIPECWLPVSPEKILLTVADEAGSTGQRNLSRFMSWRKYFDSYVLELYEKPMEWWG